MKTFRDIVLNEANAEPDLSGIEFEIVGFSSHGGFAGAEKETVEKKISSEEIKKIISWVWKTKKGTYRVCFSQGMRSCSISKGKSFVERSFQVRITDDKIECYDAEERGGGKTKLRFGETIYPGGYRYLTIYVPTLNIKREKNSDTNEI